MFSTLDSQPQEWLLNEAEALHTLCICSFVDSKAAKRWIHQLVPRDQNGRLVKWSSGRGARTHNLRRRNFVRALSDAYEDIDFSVHCISSTESDISYFAQALYLQHLTNISQEPDARGRNHLVFRLDDGRTKKLPVLRAAKLIWIYFALKYMKEVNGLDVFLYSDWFACDANEGEEKALGVTMVNLMLQGSGIGLQLSIATNPAQSEADLLSDWFAGWCNSAKSGVGDPELAADFDALLDRQPSKVDWIRYTCHRIKTKRDGALA